MPKLSVNVDHVATVRQARKGFEPDPVTAALLAELAGADGIIAHLREDRRHIQDRDIRLLRRVVTSKFNLEMAATEEMIRIAVELKPDLVTLVPEKREELTTEGGLDVRSRLEYIREVISRLKAGGVRVSLFVDPTPEQVAAAREVGADLVELHTGTYAEAQGEDEARGRFEELVTSACEARGYGLGVAVGHGLTYRNVKRFRGVAEIEEYSIGHSIVSRAVLVGMEQAVREMIRLING